LSLLKTITVNMILSVYSELLILHLMVLLLKQYELQLLVMDSTDMDLVSSTSTDPTNADLTSLDSENQEECILEKTELLGLLEAFSDRTFKKLDVFGLEFMNST
jgi:hypothetical protein